MSGSEESGTRVSRKEAAREYPETDIGRKVWAETYADGGMQIELGGIDCDKELYLSRGEPEALKEVLDQLLETDDELPFKCKWEIGVNEAGDPDDWEHYHPKAKTAAEAERKAQQEARDGGMADPCVFMTEGPFKPQDPARVGREMIEEVFGDGE